LRVIVDGDASTIVNDSSATVGHQRDVDSRAVARHGFVNSVVYNLYQQVVKPGWSGRSDVHSRANAYRF
jgi:hypothetical protein